MTTRVAPYTGAWIEIFDVRSRSPAALLVAPYTGAWIEIHSTIWLVHSFKSLPTRERGLKSKFKFRFYNVYVWSLPTRERGLKYKPGHVCREHRLSLPTRERGLKSVQRLELRRRLPSLPTRERGLKLRKQETARYRKMRRSLHGSVD